MKKRILAFTISLLVCGLVVAVIGMTAQAHGLCRVTCRTYLTEEISPIPPARTVSAGAPFMIAGLLSYQSDSKPISGKTITVTSTSPLIAGSTTTGDTGRYIFEPIAPNKPGQYKVIVQFAGDTGLAASGSSNVLTVTVACLDSSCR